MYELQLEIDRYENSLMITLSCLTKPYFSQDNLAKLYMIKDTFKISFEDTNNFYLQDISENEEAPSEILSNQNPFTHF